MLRLQRGVGRGRPAGRGLLRSATLAAHWPPPWSRQDLRLLYYTFPKFWPGQSSLATIRYKISELENIHVNLTNTHTDTRTQTNAHTDTHTHTRTHTRTQKVHTQRTGSAAHTEETELPTLPGDRRRRTQQQCTQCKTHTTMYNSSGTMHNAHNVQRRTSVQSRFPTNVNKRHQHHHHYWSSPCSEKDIWTLSWSAMDISVPWSGYVYDQGVWDLRTTETLANKLIL